MQTLNVWATPLPPASAFMERILTYCLIRFQKRVESPFKPKPRKIPGFAPCSFLQHFLRVCDVATAKLLNPPNHLDFVEPKIGLAPSGIGSYL